MTRTLLLSQIQIAVRDTFQLAGDIPTFELDLAVDPKFGDYATNAAMVLGKATKTPPHTVAETLIPVLLGIEGVAKAEIAGPGFINLTMDGEYWAHQLADDWIPKDRPRLGKLQVEFISANPTGPMTLANARGGFVGDSLASVLSRSGWDVEREYYINDVGGQVTKLADSVRAEKGQKIEGERQYQGEYIGELAAKIDLNDQKAEVFERELVAMVVQEYLKPAVFRLGIEFDTWFSEASLLTSGDATEVIAALRKTGLVEERDGAVWLRSTELGDERDRVLVRSTGESTYLLSDLGYHWNIFKKRKFDCSIKVWGADHAGQVASLKLGLGALVPAAQLDVVLLQFVRLIRDGVEMKMSKRAGTYVTIDELLDMLEEGVGKEHAVNVARWFFLSRSVDNKIDFDLGIAKEESQKNPYFYVMYSYARALSLLAKAKENGMIPLKPDTISQDAELMLTKLISQVGNTQAQIAYDYGVQRLPHLCYELAKAFTSLYEYERIIDLPVPEASSRLYVVQRYVEALEYVFELMGIEPVRRMIS